MARARGTRRRLLVAAAVLALFASIGAGALHAAGSHPPRHETAAERMLLRLHDLPLGYRTAYGSPEFSLGGFQCHSVEPANAQPSLGTFLDRYRPYGCLALYMRLFRVPSAQPAPLVIGSGAIATKSVEEAEAALAISPELISHAIGDELPEEVPAPTAIGDASRLFHWDHPDLFVRGKSASSFLVWRSGNAVAAIFVAGSSAEANDRAAFELGARQQRHLEVPTPYTAAERDEREVALENPALNVPVYWLGQRFPRHRGLPRLWLYDSGSTAGGTGRNSQASLLYVDHLNLDHAEGVYIDVWSPRQWKRLETRGGSLPSLPECPSSENPLRLPRNHAMVYSGFEARLGSCKAHGGRTYTARVRLGRAIVTVQTIEICVACASAGHGSYNSFAGMKAIVRGLELRQPKRTARRLAD